MLDICCTRCNTDASMDVQEWDGMYIDVMYRLGTTDFSVHSHLIGLATWISNDDIWIFQQLTA